MKLNLRKNLFQFPVQSKIKITKYTSNISNFNKMKYISNILNLRKNLFQFLVQSKINKIKYIKLF